MTYITCQWVNAVGCIARVLGPANAVHAGAHSTVARWILDDGYVVAIAELNRTARVIAPATTTAGVITCSDNVKSIKALCESHGVPFSATDTTYTRPRLQPQEPAAYYHRNWYECKDCGCNWYNVWDCEVDDDCPGCGSKHCTPYKTEAITPTGETDSASGRKPVIIMDDDAWADEYEPGELIDLRIDQLPPHHPHCLWTQISDEQGLYIVNGCRIVNREGYYLTAKPAPAGQAIRVVIDPEDTLNFGETPLKGQKP
jgi:hypothetical protein